MQPTANSSIQLHNTFVTFRKKNVWAHGEVATKSWPTRKPNAQADTPVVLTAKVDARMVLNAQADGQVVLKSRLSLFGVDRQR